MTRLSNLTAVDSRSDWKKISRRQYWRGAKELNIPFPTGATQPQMIDICQAAGVTPDQVAKFIPVRVPTADGGEKVVMLPEDKERKYDEKKEFRRAEEMEKRIAAGIEQESAAKQKMEAEKDAEIGILRSELDDMKKMMAQLLEASNSPQKTLKSTSKETDPYKMKFMAQRKWLKEHGVELSKGDKAKPLIDEVLQNESNLAQDQQDMVDLSEARNG